MDKLIKSTLWIMRFLIIFFILGIPIKEETVFDKLYDWSYPYTASSYNLLGEVAFRSSNSFKEFINKVFSSSIPKEDDFVKLTLHSQKKDLEDNVNVEEVSD